MPQISCARSAYKIASLVFVDAKQTTNVQCLVAVKAGNRQTPSTELASTNWATYCGVIPQKPTACDTS
jgi:hypothetical protein